MSRGRAEYTWLPTWHPYTGEPASSNRSDSLAWSGRGMPRTFATPPAIGTRVKVRGNELGTGVVVRYFSRSGYLGVLVALDSPPEWWTTQNGTDCLCDVFGAEIERLDD